MYPVMQPLMSSSALSTHTGMWVCGGVLNMPSDDGGMASVIIMRG